MEGKIDYYAGAKNWLVFVPVMGLAAVYYYSTQKPGRGAVSGRQNQKQQRDVSSDAPAEQSGSDAAKKLKANKKLKPKPQPHSQNHAPSTPAVSVQVSEPNEKEDLSNRQFAEQMLKAKKGTTLSAPKNKEQRIKTVKQGSAQNTPILSSGSSQAGADADDDMSPASSPALQAGDVTDMLEPKQTGPSTLRLTAPTKPVKEKVPKQKKDEVVETQKQRQNRAKKEREQRQRQADEAQRKLLEEKQRRAAREARGEPAKNGASTSKPPALNPWTGPKKAEPIDDGTPLIVNGSTPLLDTFDAESTASSNGGLEASTAATSTTEGEPTQRDVAVLSEEEQLDMAKKQSEDESGWTTAAPRKQKKKTTANGEESGEITPVATKPVQKAAAPAPAPKATANGKTNGFSALHDEQRSDADPNDASNWDP